MARALPASLQPITTVRSYAAVAQQLQSLITSGEWAVGDRIPGERALAERFHVSRVVIREAMRSMLTSKGEDPGDEEQIGDGVALSGVAKYPAGAQGPADADRLLVGDDVWRSI